MSITAERIREEQNIASFYDSLKRVSGRMVEGKNVQGLYNLKSLLNPTEEDETDEVFGIDINLKDLAGKVPSGVFLTLNVSKDIVARLWDNFGSGNLGIARESKPKLIELTRSLGNAIQIGAFKFETEDKAKAFAELGIAYRLYFELVEETSLKAQVSDGTDWVTL